MLWDIIYYLFVVGLLAAIAVIGIYFLKGYAPASLPLAGRLFGPRPAKRLDIVEQSNLDGRRRLVLIRRDDVEHLIMTGGPVDVLIETGIPHRGSTSEVANAPAVFSRQSRALGQAAGD